MPVTNVALANGGTLTVVPVPAVKRARASAWERKRQSDWRVRLLMFLGGSCEKCGTNDHRVLQVDHVNGGGSKFRREGMASSAFRMARWVFSKPEEYQLLCANCNWIKRYENQEHGTRTAGGVS